MKKTIKIIFAVFMSVLIICFSCVPAFADTSVDSGTISLAYFQKLIKDNNFSLDCSLAKLPVDDYLVVAEYSTYYTDNYLYFNFIPRSGKRYVYLNNINSYNDFKNAVTADNDTIYLCQNSKGYLTLFFTSDFYTLRLSNVSSLRYYPVADAMYKTNSLYLYFGSDIKHIDNTFVNEKSLFDKISEVTTVYSLIDPVRNKATLDYCSSLFAYCTQLVSGYSGAVYDSSLENILSQNGKTCDDSIIDKYKYQIYYSLNMIVVTPKS